MRHDAKYEIDADVSSMLTNNLGFSNEELSNMVV